MNLPSDIRGRLRTGMRVNNRSELEERFLRLWTAAKGPALREQYLFHVPREGERQRQWRFDFAEPASRVAVEVDGGAFTQGRHARGVGFENDLEKLNTAQEQGWHVFRLTERMVNGGWVERIMAHIAKESR